MNYRSLFLTELEEQAINRLQKFGKLCESVDYLPVLGFSGGKDSQVVYDLAKRSGIKFKAIFRHAFESIDTMNFIRRYYPDVEWNRLNKYGWIENISRNHNSILPTAEFAYCCRDYKHNKNMEEVNGASIVGVRRQEGNKRAGRQVLEFKNKTTKKKIQYADYFEERCTGTGTGANIQLKPIVDWSSEEVWEYIRKHNLPVNPEYANHKRVGCIICPKASFSSNVKTLYRYPKLINAIISAREKRNDIDWIISNDGINGEDYTERKAEYVCLWLNHSFRKLEGKNKKEYEKFIEFYKKKIEK